MILHEIVNPRISTQKEHTLIICNTNDDGEITIILDSRWQFPETFGYKPDDPEYAELQKLWGEATGETIPDKTTPDSATEVLNPTD